MTSTELNTQASEELDILRDFASLTSEASRERTFIEVPKLLSEAVHAAWRAEIEHAPEAERERLSAAVTWLEEKRILFEHSPERYPFGRGPVEELVSALHRGEIAREEAWKRSARRELVGLLSLVYVKALRWVVGVSMTQEPQLALDIAFVLLASTDVWPESPASWREKVLVVTLAANVAQYNLVQLPDGGLYRQIKTKAEQVLEQARARGDAEATGRLLESLGTLHLDPWVVGRDPTHYESSIANWRERLDDKVGNLRALELAELMPKPAEALRTAERYLREAVPLLEGVHRGRTLKALVQCLFWRRLALGEQIANDEFVRLVGEALALLDPERDASNILTLKSILEWLGQGQVAADTNGAIQVPVAEVVRRMGESVALLWILGVAEHANKARPAELLKWLEDATPLLAFSPSDEMSCHFWQIQSKLICLVACPELPDIPTLDALERNLEALQKPPAPDASRRAAWYLWLAIASGRFNAEERGLQLFDAAMELDPSLLERYRQVMLAVRATLHEGAGVVAYNAGQHGIAAEYYARALAGFDQLGLVHLALNTLGRLSEAIRREEDGFRAMLLLKGLAEVIPGLEARLGPAALQPIQAICRAGLGSLVRNNPTPDTLARFIQIAKGARFGLACLLGAARRLGESETPEDRSLLAAVQALQREVGTLDPGLELYPFEVAIDEDMLLSSAFDPRVADDGDRSVERLVNVQRQYTRRLNERLLSGTPTVSDAHLVSAEEVRGRLDERSVLLDVLLTEKPNGLIRAHLLLHSREETRATVLDGPMLENLGLAIGDVSIRGTADLARRFRHALRIDPGRRPFAPEAAAPIKQLYELLFQPIEEDLRALRAKGKDHLCIVPHGALHFCPLHLVGRAGSALADDWIVTYLPNLRLLMRPPPADSHRPREASVLGVSFRDQAGAALQESMSGASAIAQQYGITPLLDAEVTRERVLEALENSRFVHLSTHGRHNVAAPWFQALFVHPGEEVDSRRLMAHELLSRHLEGLELLSLSACETGLGRFDESDNLMGLPAGLFLAGLSTLVGTLWRVNPEPTELFFTELHGALRAGMHKREAFAKAQRAVRERFHNNYKAWGGFFLSGSWHA